jgi:hypothetical protein
MGKTLLPGECSYLRSGLETSRSRPCGGYGSRIYPPPLDHARPAHELGLVAASLAYINRPMVRARPLVR